MRYLDNQRDVAWELFGGDVASEMGLGEAIVRGILPAPKYVITAFKYKRNIAGKNQWENRFDSQWAHAYRKAETYYRQHSTLDLPVAYLPRTALRLGNGYADRNTHSKSRSKAARQ